MRGKPIETIDDFWEAVSDPCGLPPRFGRNVEAWLDTIQRRAISGVIDHHDALIVHVDRAGFFSRSDRKVRDPKWAFAGRQSQLVIHQPAQPVSET
ncbi:barstar family protein [Actinoplanes sp. NEAU-A11]|uniref:Barstar family protein n=1 Tax=Actinoplanes aureus TaxID=2792083 RepID=A0A931CKR7_9ACTN|nr:barstar family protein [Actinoplanes aureus]